MSTYIYLQCLDHDPPLRAQDESGQHYYDLPRIRADVANRVELIGEYDSGELWRRNRELGEMYDWRDPFWFTPGAHDPYFQLQSVPFLADHLGCNLGIVTEYGKQLSLDGSGDTDELRAAMVHPHLRED